MGDEITDLTNKSTKEKTAKKSKQSSEDVNEDKKTEKRNSNVGGRKRKRYDAYKALFKSQRIRTESVCSTRAEVVHDDIVEQILIRLDVKNLIRCKRVCKSWHSLITSPGFINRHLNRSYNKDCNNDEIGHRRISSADHHLIGSSNGLVVVCTSYIYAKLLVGNPLTREVSQLGPPPCIPSPLLCWGFGHDSASDDYAVLVGARAGENENENPTSFQVQLQVLRLSTNVWKVVGEVKYTFITNAGILCNGALHWIVEDKNRTKLILSYDISKEVFKEVCQPDDPRYECGSSSRLGIVKGCLCVYEGDENSVIWLMEYNVKESWVLVPHGREMKYDIVHYLPKRNSLFCIDESCFFGTLEYICAPTKHIDAPVFVQSLVSPNVNRTPEEKTQARQVLAMGLQTALPSVYYFSSILMNLHSAYNQGGPSGHGPSA